MKKLISWKLRTEWWLAEAGQKGRGRIVDQWLLSYSQTRARSSDVLLHIRGTIDNNKVLCISKN
jgi:hypothetical protein